MRTQGQKRWLCGNKEQLIPEPDVVPINSNQDPTPRNKHQEVIANVKIKTLWRVEELQILNHTHVNRLGAPRRKRNSLLDAPVPGSGHRLPTPVGASAELLYRQASVPRDHSSQRAEHGTSGRASERRCHPN